MLPELFMMNAWTTLARLPAAAAYSTRHTPVRYPGPCTLMASAVGVAAWRTPSSVPLEVISSASWSIVSENRKGGCTTRTSPTTKIEHNIESYLWKHWEIVMSPISIQRITDRKVRGRLRMMASRMTLNTGEMKASTMRSPMGISPTAMTQLKLEDAVRKPLKQARHQFFMMRLLLDLEILSVSSFRRFASTPCLLPPSRPPPSPPVLWVRMVTREKTSTWRHPLTRDTSPADNLAHFTVVSNMNTGKLKLSSNLQWFLRYKGWFVD